ncbi:quinone oxidoreductase [uncultured Piscinibacter sp.]|uniref:quinone oxidoreductase family protein n=1 Tax=uncultured Piscinibacter sp. TaxID=1131835 RepID=UPI002602200C|nr:quinone oxidoreductase [uncultured Piscinibacter sp.]
MTDAIVIEAYGAPEVMQLRRIDVPSPGPGQVRLRHTRIGVNFHDVYVRNGMYRTLDLPGTPGIEAAGVVVECGEGVTTWRPGDRAAYVSGAYGVYASERLIDAALLLRLPDGVSDDAAASVLLRGLTADMLLRRVHRVSAGDWVLVQAAAGGVGQLLCRWAQHLGAKVIGTVAHAGQAEAAARAGCTLVLDSRRDDVAQRVREATGGAGVAVAYDGVGRDTFEGSLQSLGFCGHLVNFGQASGAVAPFEVAQLATRSLSLTRPIIFHHLREAAVREAMAGRVFAALGSGVLGVGTPRLFALAEAAQAHRALEAEGATTPLLLVP